MLIFDKHRDSYQVEGYKQFDTTKPLIAKFFDDAQPINLANYNVRFECLKPDGHIVIQDNNLTIQNTNEISMLIDKQITVVEGVLKCQFVLLNKTGGTQDSTFTFFVDVQKSAINIATYSDSVITTLETINTQINEATTVSTSLASANRVATNTNKTLTATNETASRTNTTLTETNRVAGVTNTNLNATNTRASQTNDTLNATNTKASQTNTTLNATNTTATETNTNLGDTVTRAVNANRTLGATNDTATTKKTELDQSISNAQKVIGGGAIVEDFTGSTIPNLTETKARIKVNNAYKIPITRDDAVFVATNKTLKTKISEMDTTINTKVDKSGSKVLSDNNYTADEKSTVAWAKTLRNGGATIGGATSINGAVSITDKMSVTGDLTAKANVLATGNVSSNAVVSAGGYLSSKRYAGASGSDETFNVGSGNCRVDVAGNNFRLFSTGVGSDNGIIIENNGTVVMKSNNVAYATFSQSGKKTAGTMEVDGTVYGMSPTDSPQTLIEYVIPNVKVENELKLDLDPIYIKMVSYYVAFLSSRHIDIKEKGNDYILLTGNGVTDILIKGQRKDAEDYYRIMSGFTHGVNETNSD